MPDFLIAHQTPTLLIKMRYPKKFDGVALCIGAMAPDFNGFIDIFTNLEIRRISHSLLGLLIWTLPLTLILTIIFSRFIGPWISKFAKKENTIFYPLKYFGLDELLYLKNKKFNRRFFIIASISAIIGGFTHLILDLPSHQYIELFYPWALLNYPDLFSIPLIIFKTINLGPREFIITQFTVTWIIEDIIFVITTLFLLRYIKSHNLISKWKN